MLRQSKDRMKVTLTKWKVKQDSVLEESLVFQMLKKGISDDFIINRDGIGEITNFLKQYPRMIIKP